MTLDCIFLSVDRDLFSPRREFGGVSGAQHLSWEGLMSCHAQGCVQPSAWPAEDLGRES